MESQTNIYDSVLMQINLRGDGNPILSNVLEDMFGITGPEVREIVREARRKGVPIANSTKGYFRAENFIELEPTLKDLHKRAMSLLVTRKEMAKCFGVDLQGDLFA